MNQLETGEAFEAARGNSDLQKELAEVRRQRAAISEVLRAIANSPHDLQPIFDTTIANAVHLCGAEGGGFRCLFASLYCPVVSEMYPPLPANLLEHDNFLGRLLGKSPVHITDLATHLERNSVGEVEREAISRGVRTVLYVPMLRNDELIGTLGLARWRPHPFTQT